MADTQIDFGGAIKGAYNPANQSLDVTVIGSTIPIDTPIPVTLTLGTVQYTFAVPFSDITNSPFIIVASTSVPLTQILPYDTTGVAIGLYINGVLAINMGPGYDVPTPIEIPLGSEVSIEALSATPTAGTWFAQLIG